MQLIKQKKCKCQNDIVLRGMDGFADSYCTFASRKDQNRANMQGARRNVNTLCILYSFGETQCPMDSFFPYTS